MRRTLFWQITPSIVLAVAVAMAGESVASAASPREMLEKAIYTEETVGNVDEAIKLYEQVIAEAKAVRGTAAQAQYRLAQCLLKKGKTAESNAALAKLIKDFPEEKEWIAKARKLLPGEIKLAPAPWQDHEALHLNLKLGTGLDIGVYIYMIDAAKYEGKDASRCSTRAFVAINDLQSYSTVLVDKETFAPISSRWMHSLLGDVEAVYKPQAVEIKDRLKNTTREINVDGPVFDNEECAELFRRLPLAVGYKTAVPIVSTLGSGKLNIELEVTGKETVDVAAGKFECFKLVLNIGQTFYVSTDEHRYLVKFEAGGVRAELTRIDLLEPGKPLRFDGRGFSLTLPERWFAYLPEQENKDDEPSAAILDEYGAATAKVAAKVPKADQPQPSLKEWADAEAEKTKKLLKDYQPRAGEVKERTVAGRPAFSAAADFTENGKKLVIYNTDVFGERLKVSFTVSLAPDRFEAYRKDFDKLVDSLQWQK
jgi:hypothetical protein